MVVEQTQCVLDKITKRAALFGRKYELSVLNELLAAVARGNGGAALIVGGVGTGKTALLEALASSARHRGFVVLRGRGSSREQRLRFGLAHRLFSPAVPLLPVDMECTGPRHHPLSLVGEAVSLGSRPEPGASSDELSGLRSVLCNLARRSPVLLAIDDIHLADEASLRWLGALAASLEQAPVCLLVTQSRGELASHAALLDDLLASCRLEVRQDTLGLPAVTAWFRTALGSAAEPSLVAACHEATGGNPLLLTSLIDLLSGVEGAPGRLTFTQDHLPDTTMIATTALPSIMNARIRRVSPHALAIARSIATLGVESTVERVCSMTGLGIDVVSAVATALAGMGLVRRGGPRLCFTYPLTSRVVFAGVPLDVVEKGHVQAARLLNDVDAGDDQVAAHLLGAPPIGEPWVCERLRAAAALYLERGAVEEATACLRRAAIEPSPDHLRAVVLTELADAEERRDPQTAIGTYRAAADLVTCPDQRRELLWRRAHLLRLIGRRVTGPERADVVDARDAGTSRPHVIELWLSHASTARKALDLLDGVDARAADNARLLGLLADRECWAGTARDQATTLACRTLASAQQPADIGSRLRAVRVLAQAGRLTDAAERCASYVRQVEKSGQLIYAAMARCLSSAIAEQTGALDAALDDARASLDMILEAGLDPSTGIGPEHVARLMDASLAAGDHASALQALERFDLAGEVPHTLAGVALLIARGRLRCAIGQGAEAVADLQSAGKWLRNWGIENPAVAAWRPPLAAALVLLGRRNDARACAAEGLDRARRWGAPGPLGDSLCTLGLVVGGDAGLALLREAAAVLEQSPARTPLLRALMVYGDTLATTDVIAARQVLHRAVDLAEECGSPTLTGEARDKLHAAGGRCTRSAAARTGPGALTRAERQVVLLAAQGMTNREIADKQFVVRRTVELHLTSAYRKLGVTSRQELGACVANAQAARGVTQSSGVDIPGGDIPGLAVRPPRRLDFLHDEGRHSVVQPTNGRTT
jgi:DNA-binding CsgD family transcriptional regulator/tetratricopeptide (TPR) repeat protein